MSRSGPRGLTAHDTRTREETRPVATSLSAYSNQRTDECGGCLADRVRLALRLQGRAAERRRIGDADVPRRIAGAIGDSHRVGRAL